MGNAFAYDFSAVGRRAAPLLILVGTDGDPKQKKAGGYRISGNSDIYKLLPESLRFDSLNLSKQFLQQQDRPDPARFRCVLNLVTDADQHPQTLERVRKLLRGYHGRVINRPEAVLRTSRDQVARRLAGIAGLQVPKVLRLRVKNLAAALQAVEHSGMAFPAILRRAGTHSGIIVGRVGSLDELRVALAEPGDYVLTEFVDFASDDGLYRKLRFFFYGRRRVFRHMLISDNWDIHARDRMRFMAGRPALREEEAARFAQPDGAFPPAVHEVLEAVGERMGLDYFGMDCGLARDGRLVLFEANATMNFLPFMTDRRFAYLEACLAPAQAAVRELVEV